MSYPGGKEGAGIWQRIVNLMPPHRVYVELFAGGGAVLRHKEAAYDSIALDLDPDALATLEERYRTDRPDDADRVLFLEQDALDWLRKALSPTDAVNAPWLTDSVLIYADPPYPLSVRRTDRVRYHRELSDEDHVELLELLSQTAARVMLSGYRCALYDAWLTTWRRIDYQAMTRGGTVPESLWLNFDPPATLHGYDRVGSDYRERERIKRKRQRWLANFSRLPDHEREAIFSDLSNYQAGRQS